MGLDMYLTLTHSVDKQEQEAIQGAMGDFYRGLQRLNGVTFTAAYWRKANQIHRWFVANVQDGNDDCGRYYVSREQLKHLLEDCKAVLADNKKVELLLPPSNGFFFGSQEIDDGYWHDIAITIKQLEEALFASRDGNDYFEYHASW